MTARKIPDIIKQVSRDLRKKMTKSEVVLWNKLRAKKLLWKKFLRQYPIYVYTEDYWLERFIIPDFVCKEHKLVIELDWSIHDLKEIYLLDKIKENLLISNWFKVLRFKNNEILSDLQIVLEKIWASFS